MAIELTVNQRPDPGFNNTVIVPVGNPIKFVFNPVQTTGSTSSLATITPVDPAAIVPAGTQISINGRIFTALTNPGPGDLTAGISYSDLGTQLYSQVLNDPQLVTQVTANLSYFGPAWSLTLYAVLPGTAYNITIDLLNSLLFEVTFPAINGSAAGSTKDYGVRANLFVDDDSLAGISLTNHISFNSPLIRRIGTPFDAKTDRTDRAAIDLQNALKSEVTTYAPAVTESLVQEGFLQAPRQRFYIAPEMLKRFYLEYSEFYTPTGERLPRVVGQIQREGFSDVLPRKTYYAINSSNLQQLPELSGASNFKLFWDRTDGPIRALTLQPESKITHVDEYELLYFVYYRSGNERKFLSLRYFVILEDGSPVQVFGIIWSPPIGSVLYVEVGFRQLLALAPTIESANNSLVQSFTVQVIEHTGNINTGTPVTIAKRYVMNNAERCNAYQRVTLLFQNPMGGFDSIRMSGHTVVGQESRRGEVRTDPAWLYINNRTRYVKEGVPGQFFFENREVVPDGITNRKSTGTDSVVTYKLSTGLLDQTHVEWLQRSFVNSNQIYLMEWQTLDNGSGFLSRQARRVNLSTRKIERSIQEPGAVLEFELVSGMGQSALE